MPHKLCPQRKRKQEYFAQIPYIWSQSKWLSDIAEKGRAYGVRFVLADSSEPECCGNNNIAISSEGSSVKIKMAEKREVSICFGNENAAVWNDLTPSDSYVPCPRL